MGLPPFTVVELRAEKELIDSFTGGEKHWHWARKHTGYAKLERLREYVGMDGWSHNYKLASRNLHSDYYEIGNLLAMSEAEADILLVGQSNSGLADPAQFTAISLLQITSTFLFTYSEDESSQIDYTDSVIFTNILDVYAEQVGVEMVAAQNKK